MVIIKFAAVDGDYFEGRDGLLNGGSKKFSSKFFEFIRSLILG